MESKTVKTGVVRRKLQTTAPDDRATHPLATMMWEAADDRHWYDALKEIEVVSTTFMHITINNR